MIRQSASYRRAANKKARPTDQWLATGRQLGSPLKFSTGQPDWNCRLGNHTQT